VTVVFYISGHGLGHASREIEVINSVTRQRPDTRVIVRTSAPRWFLENAARGPIELQEVEVDTGIVQIDSLRLDEDETALRAARFYATFEARAEAEAHVLAELDASVVVGDVPPLAFAAAARARVQSVALANFTWDWIYGAYLGDDAVVVLASFGGYGLRLPYREIARVSRFTLVVTGHETGPEDPATEGPLRRYANEELAARDLHYPDLVAAADAVISKPGYGIVSECIVNGTALLYTARGRFVEDDMLVAEMPRMLRWPVHSARRPTDGPSGMTPSTRCCASRRLPNVSSRTAPRLQPTRSSRWGAHVHDDHVCDHPRNLRMRLVGAQSDKPARARQKSDWNRDILRILERRAHREPGCPARGHGVPAEAVN
jgi:hypothetical protein